MLLIGFPALLSFLKKSNFFFFFNAGSFPLLSLFFFFFLVAHVGERWLFLKPHIVPSACSSVCSDKIPFLRGVRKICWNSSSSLPPLLLGLSTVRQWKFPPFANGRESTKLQSSLRREGEKKKETKTNPLTVWGAQ